MAKRTMILLDRLHWLWLAMAAPFLLFPSPKRSVVMLVVPALILLRWMVIKWTRQKNRGGKEISIQHQHSALPFTPINGTLFLMMVMVLVSMWATFDINYSLPKISGMVLGVGIFFAVVREGERLRGWILSLLAFIGGGLGIATLGVFGTKWFTSKISFLDPITTRLPRLITGLQGAESGFHPNEVAGALTWVLPLMMAVSVALMLFSKSPKTVEAKVIRNGLQEKIGGWRLVIVRIVLLAATLFTAAVFMLCQSRGGYIGLALALLVLIIIALPSRWRKYSLAILLLFAILLGMLLASRWGAVRQWAIGGNPTADPALSLDTLEGRVELWSRAIYGIQDFPFTGMGMNTFRKVVPVLYPPFFFGPEIDIGHAHNEFLQVALDLGIPGLVAFLALYTGSFWMLSETWRATCHLALNNKCWSLVIRLIVLGLGGGLLAHLLYGLTDTVALGAKPGVLFWMLLGLIAGLNHLGNQHWAVFDGISPATEMSNEG